MAGAVLGTIVCLQLALSAMARLREMRCCIVSIVQFCEAGAQDFTDDTQHSTLHPIHTIHTTLHTPHAIPHYTLCTPHHSTLHTPHSTLYKLIHTLHSIDNRTPGFLAIHTVNSTFYTPPHLHDPQYTYIRCAFYLQSLCTQHSAVYTHT